MYNNNTELILTNGTLTYHRYMFFFLISYIADYLYTNFCTSSNCNAYLNQTIIKFKEYYLNVHKKLRNSNIIEN